VGLLGSVGMTNLLKNQGFKGKYMGAKKIVSARGSHFENTTDT
jgi:hypothetical protein